MPGLDAGEQCGVKLLYANLTKCNYVETFRIISQLSGLCGSVPYNYKLGSCMATNFKFREFHPHDYRQFEIRFF